LASCRRSTFWILQKGYLRLLLCLYVPFAVFTGCRESGFSQKNKIFKLGCITALVLLIIIVALNLDGFPFQYQPNRQLNQMRTIADFVMTQTNVKPFNFALISGGNSDYAYRYFFTIWNHPPITIEDPQHDPLRKTVTNQLFVVCESPLPCQPLGIRSGKLRVWQSRYCRTLERFGRRSLQTHPL